MEEAQSIELARYIACAPLCCLYPSRCTTTILLVRDNLENKISQAFKLPISRVKSIPLRERIVSPISRGLSASCLEVTTQRELVSLMPIIMPRGPRASSRLSMVDDMELIDVMVGLVGFVLVPIDSYSFILSTPFYLSGRDWETS